MAKGNNARRKEIKKPKKNTGKPKGNPWSNVPAGRAYPGSFPIAPDIPGTNRT